MVFALITCILTVGSVSAADTGNKNTGLANSSCPEYGINNNHTGQSNYTGPQTNNTKWNITVVDNVNGTINSRSAVTGSDGTVYVGSSSSFYAVNPNGTIKWTYNIRPIYSAPAIGADGTIYVCNNSAIYALTDHGTYATQKWNYTVTGEPSGISIASNGTIYLGTSGGYLYSITDNGTSAIMNWVYHNSAVDSYTSAPAIGSDGTIYVVNGKVLTAIKDNGISPTVRWTYTYKSATSSGISIGSDGTLYIGTSKGIYAVKDNGDTTYTVKWTYELGSIYGIPAISSDGTIYVITTDQSTKSTLYAIKDNGDTTYTVKWTYDAAPCNGRIGITIGADGTIYFGTKTGMYAINPNGTQKWNHTTGNIQMSPTIGPDGTLYVGTGNGNFYAFKDVGSSFTAGITTGSKTVKFNDNSTGTPTSWHWNFGDGTTSTEQNPTHTYAHDGTYTVTLTVTNSYTNDTNTQTYTIDTTAPTASANVKAGTYNTNKVVTLYMSENGAIYYTLDGTNPTTASTRYTGPIIISSTKTLKYIAVDNAGNTSPVYAAKYTIDKIAPKISAIYPKKNAKNISRTKTIAIKFSEKISATINWSKVYVKNLKTGKKVKISKIIKNNMLYIKTGKRSANTWYQVYIPASAVKDIAGNKAKGYVWNFKTGKR